MPYKLAVRLTDEQQRELVASYVAGASGRQLAERYSLARSSVLELLKSRGVVLRYPRLTAEERALVVRLYQLRVRQVDIARELGRDKGHIWHVLRRAGVL